MIKQLRPACAIVAGGRPAQARALEAEGISAFLHVPSPGLLRQFLEDGARKFVFEGSECGGHTGPRASFPLWEAQLGVIEDWLAAGGDGCDVLFAGGIHDARSAAMVAALARRPATLGVRVGVLMGTSYLFTDEAVACGAIQPLFQRQVVAAEATALLETAPGHTTRGVVSPFTDEFERVKQRYRAEGLAGRDAWERLEELNVGRLRIASKGLRREGADLVAVDEAGQLADGMFMAGQAAVLRSQITTIANLHRDVTDDARDFYARRAHDLRRQLDLTEAADLPEAGAPAPLDIAVVGMACMFPGSPDLASFWATVLDGADRVTEVPKERWDTEVYYDPTATGPDAGRTSASKWGGFLPPIPFDPLRYGIPPAALGSIEPAQLLALEAARRALVDAGCDRPDADHARTSVVFGAEAGSDLSNAGVLRNTLPAYLGTLPPELDEQLPRLTEDSFPGVLSNVIAGRIANRLDLGGANYTVDAACASSLAAVDVACKELTGGTSDLVLCGAVDLHNGINDFLLFTSVHALSPSGRSRTFDAAADGIALGEGAACVVLKRLADAERDGDRVYAVIRAVGSASDGRALGLTAPRPDGQRRALERAYRNARISPARVGLLEAHGTGTVVGDRTELSTLAQVFGEAGAAPGGCTLGSVKSQIGHTKCAAGLAGLIKATMALHTGVRPPTANISTPNPAWDGARSPFVFDTVARPWAAAPADRVAGVSAFGFGGTNFHVVLTGHERAVDVRHGRDEWPAELFVFRGADRTAAHRSISRLLGKLKQEPKTAPWRLRDLALSAARAADARTDRAWVALVPADLDELAHLADRALQGEHDPASGLFQPDGGDFLGAGAGTAFLFPGQGSQRPGMLAELFVAFPELQRYLRLGSEWADLLHPPAAFDEQSLAHQAESVRDTRAAQPVLGVAGLAVDHLLRRLGIRPDAVAGHSYGELVALASADALDPAGLLAASRERARVILEAAGDDPGAMAAVAAGAEQVEAVLAAAGLSGAVVPANRNAPKQLVISGPSDAVDRALIELRAAGIGAKRIPVACAFHSPVVAEAVDAFAEILDGLEVRAPDVAVYANRTASPYPSDPAAIRAELAAQIGAPVRFAEEIEAMYAAGVRVFVEAGPGRVLTRLVGAILEGRPHAAVACEGQPDAGLRGLLGAVARLATAGVPLRTGWLVEGRDAVDAETAPRPARPGWTVDGQLVRTADGACVPGGLAPARRISPEGTVTREPAAPDQDALLAEFLRTNREMVAAQRDVMLAYLGSAPGARVVVTRQQPDVVRQQPDIVASAEPIAALAAPEPLEQKPAAGFDVLGVVLEIISARTGYPIDMIEPGVDLEADLSVDSIKRAEIAGELARRLDLGAGDLGAADLDDDRLEHLAKARTAQEIADRLSQLVGGGAQAPEPPGDQGPQTPPPFQDFAAEPVPDVRAPQRLEPREVEAAPPRELDYQPLAGTRFAILGAGEAERLAEAVTARLAEVGATVVQVHTQAQDGPPDGVIHLGGMSRGEQPLLPQAFAEIKALLETPPRWLLAARPLDAHGAGIGLRGLMRTVGREYPQTLVRAVELDPEAAAEQSAATLVDELVCGDRDPVIVHRDGRRHRIETLEASLGALASHGAGPAGDGAAEARALGIDRNSVVVIVGGARGITARIAATLAAASRCRVELIGRTPLPTAPEPAATAEAADAAAIRAALIASGMRAPAQIERAVAGTLAAREVTATLDRLRDLGSRARYHALDVRDGDALRQLLKDIHAEQGRIDGVVHAAGIIEDRTIAEKTPESFARVYATKADGARALFAGLDHLPEPPRFSVLFGSIAAVFGNRGQSDYAAANDALESLGAAWSARTGARCLTVHWGPWAPSAQHGGMVTAELMQAYAKRGIAMIDPEEGALSLLRELAWGGEASAVVYAASGW